MPYKLGFAAGSPIDSLYQALIRSGVKDKAIDRGYVTTDFSKPGPNEQTLNQSGTIEEREVLTYALDHYENYQDLIEGYTGYPFPWAIKDPARKAKIQGAIGSLKEILRKQGIRQGTPEYEKKLAIALFYFVDFPETKEEISAMWDRLPARISKLYEVGMEQFQTHLYENGGLGTGLMKEDAPTEASADESLRIGKGACSEQSKILFAVFRMAGLHPFFVRVKSAEIIDAYKKEGQELDDPLVWQAEHVLVGMKFGTESRLFDLTPTFFGTGTHLKLSSYYPLSPIQMLTYDRTNRGKSFSSLGRGDTAIHEYGEAIKLSPEAALPHANLCGLFAEQWKDFEAEKECRQAIQLEPDFMPSYINLSQILIDRNKYEEAVEAARRAIELAPNFGGSYAGLGYALHKLDKREEAIQAYRLMIDSGFTDRLFILADYGFLLSELGLQEESVSIFKKFKERAFSQLTKSPSDADQVYALIVDMIKNLTPEGRKTNALTEPLRQVLNKIGTIYQQEGRLAELEKVRQSALQITTSIPETHPLPESAPKIPSRWQLKQIFANPFFSWGIGIKMTVNQPHFFQEIEVPTTWRNRENNREIMEGRTVSVGLGVHALFNGELGYFPFDNRWVRHSVFVSAGFGVFNVDVEKKEGYKPVTPDIDSSGIFAFELNGGTGAMLATPYVRPYANFIASGMTLLGNGLLDNLLRKGEGPLRHDLGFEAGLEIDHKIGHSRIFLGDESFYPHHDYDPDNDKYKIRLSWIRMGGSEATHAFMLGVQMYR